MAIKMDVEVFEVDRRPRGKALDASADNECIILGSEQRLVADMRCL